MAIASRSTARRTSCRSAERTRGSARKAATVSRRRRWRRASGSWGPAQEGGAPGTTPGTTAFRASRRRRCRRTTAPSPAAPAAATATATISSSTGPDAGFGASTLRGGVDRDAGPDHDQDGDDGQGDLQGTEGPLAVDLAGGAVDEHLEHLAAEEHRQQPDGQEQVLEGQGVELRRLGLDPLVVAADVALDRLLDLLLHVLLGVGEAGLHPPVVGAAQVPGGVLRREGLGAVGWPGLELAGELPVEAGVGQDGDVVEGVGHPARHVAPAGAGLGVLVLAAADGDGVVVAPLAVVVRLGLGVVGEVGGVEAGERPRPAVLLELVGGEPAALDAALQRRFRLLLVDPEREHPVDGRAGRGVRRVVALDGRGAVRAAGGRQAALEGGLPAAALAGDLLLADDRRDQALPGLLLQLLHGRPVVALGHAGVALAGVD